MRAIPFTSWFDRQPEWFKNGTSAAVALVTVSALHARAREALVLQRLHTGWCPRRCFTAAMADSLRKRRRHFVEREAEASALRRILVPKQAAVHCFFYFVTGPSGGGKTTMVQRICHQVRNGVVYVAAGSDPAQFGQQLGNALQLVEQLPNPIILIYDYVLHIAGGVEQERTSRLTSALAALGQAARHFKAAHRRTPVLVIDNAERLADSEAVLREVLFSAQQWADRGLVRTVFVTSDDALITRLLSQSRCSKAGSLELGDLSEAEAHGYLRAQGVGEKDAARVVEVTGGRLLHLLAALEALGQGDSVQGVRRHALAAAEADFQKAGLLDDTPQRCAGVRLARALLAQEAGGCGSPGIDTAEWNRVVPNPADKEALLGSNSFARKYGGRCGDSRIVFESRAAAAYAREVFSCEMSAN